MIINMINHFHTFDEIQISAINLRKDQILEFQK